MHGEYSPKANQGLIVDIRKLFYPLAHIKKRKPYTNIHTIQYNNATYCYLLELYPSSPYCYWGGV